VSEKLRIGTRRSPLAMWQAEHVRDRLQEAHAGLEVELVPTETRGDKILDVALSKVGGKGLFVKELEVALLEERVDLCVHSTKDMPADLPEGLGLVAFPPRADPRDAFVMGGQGGVLALDEGARVGTSSLRRQAQLLALRPDLEIVSVRGNIQTRMKKVAELELECVVLACAGIDRMAAEENIGHRFEPEEMLPAAAQGILGIEARTGDERVLELLKVLDDEDAQRSARCERAFLKTLGGGCQVPIAAYSTRSGDTMTLRGLVASPDGRVMVRGTRAGPADRPEALGRALGEEVLATGGRRVLVEVGIGEAVSEGGSALSGATVVVARDDAPDDNISLALSAQGADVVPLRLMRLDEPADGSGLEAAVRDLAQFDVLCFTSRAAVERFFDRLKAAGRDLRGLRADALVAAVGPRTREALAHEGAHVDVVGDGGGAELAAAIEAALPLDGKKLLLPRAEGGREELREVAERRGAEVVVVDAYRSAATADAVEAVTGALGRGGDAKRRVMFLTSPRRVEVLAGALGDDRAALDGWALLAIGETTRAALDEHGLAGASIAPSPTPAGVTAAVRSLLAEA
jgi:hydroxymethylbilane synthase